MYIYMCVCVYCIIYNRYTGNHTHQCHRGFSATTSLDVAEKNSAALGRNGDAKRCEWKIDHSKMLGYNLSNCTWCFIPLNVGKTIMNHPFGNDLKYSFVVIWRMVFVYQLIYGDVCWESLSS
jgi:hypothetical protein